MGKKQATRTVQSRRFRPDLIVWGAILCFILVFAGTAGEKYASFSFGDIDLALINQTTWNALHGQLWGGSPGQATIFNGGHVFLVLLLVLPLYALWQSPLLLLLLQAAALGLGAWPLARLARGKLGKPYGIVFAAAYLLYPAMNYACLYEFHPVTLATPLLLGAAWALIEGKKTAYWILLALALSCREDVAIPAMALGLFALIQAGEMEPGRKKNQVLLGLGTLLAATVWFLLCIKVIQPAGVPEAVKGTEAAEAGMSFYGWLGNSPGEMLNTLLTKPGLVWSNVFTEPKRLYLLHLLAPVGFLALLSPAGALALLVSLAEGLLSQRFSHYSIRYQYSSIVTPLVFLGAVFGARNLLRLLRSPKWRIAPGFLVAGAALVSTALFGPIPRLPAGWQTWRTTPEDGVREGLVKAVPDRDPVVATFAFAPKLSGRPWLFHFYHIYSVSSHPNFRVEIPPAREKARWILADFNDWLTFYDFHTPGGDRAIRAFLEEGDWELVETVNSLALFRRGEAYAPGVIEAAAAPAEKLFPVPGLPGLQAGNCTVRPGQVLERPVARVEFDLSCSNRLPDLLFAVRLAPRGRHLPPVQEFLYAPYRIHPTGRWQPGDCLRLRANILLPQGWGEDPIDLQVLALARRPGLTGLDPRLDVSMLLNYVPGRLGVSPAQLLAQFPVCSLAGVPFPETASR